MSLREEVERYEHLTGESAITFESAEPLPIIKIRAFLDGVDKGIEELKKIKEEIQEMRNDNPSYYYTCDVIEREKLLDLLDEHIAELKQ